MMNDNKLIAEFMGRGGTFNHDKTMICTGIYPDTMTLMKYDTSWDWLMPVVEKIEEQNELIGAHILSTDIGKTYKEVVRFIKEYNNDPLGTKSIHD
jgi:hypothetical protein